MDVLEAIWSHRDTGKKIVGQPGQISESWIGRLLSTWLGFQLLLQLQLLLILGTKIAKGALELQYGVVPSNAAVLSI